MNKTKAKITDTRRVVVVVVVVDSSFIIYNRESCKLRKELLYSERKEMGIGRGNRSLIREKKLQKLKNLRWEKNENITSSERKNGI